jgi:hypothetical protein
VITLLVITDGRDELLEQTMQSFKEKCIGSVTHVVIHDDTGDEDHALKLASKYTDSIVLYGPNRLGFGGSIRNAWAWLREYDNNPYIFHLEDDFVFNTPIFLNPMCYLLGHRRYLAQVALLRQSWNDIERAAGGIIPSRPNAFTTRQEICAGLTYNWLEHREFFTTNPCMYSKWLISTTDWPTGNESEGHYGILLKTHGFGGVSGSEVKFGYWGHGLEMVTHIGKERNGTGY